MSDKPSNKAIEADIVGDSKDDKPSNKAIKAEIVGDSKDDKPSNKAIKADIVGDSKDESKEPNKKKRKIAFRFKRPYPFLARNFGKHCHEIEFQVVFLDGKGVPHLHIESRIDRHFCPFCNFEFDQEKDCYEARSSSSSSSSSTASTTQKILKHCRRYHRDHHVFELQKRRENNDAKETIIARPLIWKSVEPEKVPGNYRFVRIRSRNHRLGRRKRQKMVLGAQDLTVVLTPAESKDVSVTPSLAATALQVPWRQYYHSRSRLPMQPGAWELDSDDESDNEWLDDIGQAGLNEFTDITADEKHFLNLWKRYIRCDTVVADHTIMEKNLHFIRSHIQQLKGFRLQLLMHLMTLYEHRLIPSDHIVVCMQEYDGLVSSSGGYTGKT